MTQVGIPMGLKRLVSLLTVASLTGLSRRLGPGSVAP